MDTGNDYRELMLCKRCQKEMVVIQTLYQGRTREKTYACPECGSIELLQESIA